MSFPLSDLSIRSLRTRSIKRPILNESENVKKKKLKKESTINPVNYVSRIKSKKSVLGSIMGFKAFNKDWTCRGVEFKVGENHKLDGVPKLRNWGYHFGKYPSVLPHYYDCDKSVFALVEAIGPFDQDNDLVCTTNLRIIEEIPFELFHQLEYKKVIDGTIIYYKGVKYHRLHAPAVERADGDKEWWSEGKLHRLDGPAIELASGYKEWRIEGKYHRLDGPPIELANGSKEC